MKMALLFLLGAALLFPSGCAFGPTIDEQAHEQTQRNQVEKRSDAFAHSLQQ